MSRLERAFKCQNRWIIVVGCGTFSTASLAVPGVGSAFGPHLPHDPVAQRFVQIRHKKPSLSINSYKGPLCAVWEWKIAFIKASDWDLRGDEFLTSSSLSQGLFVILGHSLLLSMLQVVSCMAAHTLEKPVALTWLLGSVSPGKPCGVCVCVCCAGPKGSSFPCREKSVMVFNQLECGSLFSHCAW